MEIKAQDIKQRINGKIKILNTGIKILAIFMSLYHIYNVIGGGIEPLFYRFTHLSLGLLLGFIISFSGKKDFSKLSSLLFVVITVFIYSYFYLQYDRLVALIPGFNMLTNWDKIVGILLIILVLESTRRYIGWVLPLISIIFLVYLFIGPNLPGILNHKGLSLSHIIHYLTFSFEGIFGSAIAVSSGYIVLFLIFGNFLSVAGIGEYFVNLATTLAGGTRGGAAKIAILSSAFIGTIIGAPTANVAITGSFTIPLMKQKGFKPDFAAGVEAAASTGGLILPPIMGSTAFIMADILGISYIQIARASLIPAIIYFLSILIMVDIYALKNNLSGLPKRDRPLCNVILRESYKLLPLIIITMLLIKGFSPAFAAIGGLASALVLSIYNIRDWIFIKKSLEALEKASITAIQLISACAVSGIIMGVFSLTGLSGKITHILLQTIGKIEIFVLIFIMISALVLGSSLAITPTYLLCAVWGVPVLASFGFEPLAAHLFIFYFAVFAPLTPPFAITSYVAANIAGGELGKTAIKALYLASSGFIIPYMFIYHNELLMMGSVVDTLVSIVKLITGITFVAVGIQGFFYKKLNIYQRIFIILGGILVIVPGFISDLVGISMIGIIIFLTTNRAIKINKKLHMILKGE